MSVPEYARALGKSKVISAALENCKHTLKVCKSEKNFPKRDRWILTNKIVSDAEDILKCCILSTNITVTTAGDYELRRRYQMQAKGYAMDQLALMLIAYESLSLEISEEYWIDLVDKFLALLQKWNDSDRRRYGHLLDRS